jgi:hypothetical protein
VGTDIHGHVAVPLAYVRLARVWVTILIVYDFPGVLEGLRTVASQTLGGKEKRVPEVLTVKVIKDEEHTGARQFCCNLRCSVARQEDSWGIVGP